MHQHITIERACSNGLRHTVRMSFIAPQTRATYSGWCCARHKLNGRQIRNTVNTARQLARYKKETIRYAHIDQAIGVVNEFEKYVTDVHGHDDEEYAQDQGLRNDQALRDVD